MDIFVTRAIRREGLELLSTAATYEVWDGAVDASPPKDAIIKGVKQAKVLLSLLTETIDREILTVNPNLLGVANCAVGFNNIDIAAATELGVPVTNTPGVLTDTTADLTWALILAVARCIPEAHQYMLSGKYKLWGPNLLLGSDVSPGGSEQPKTLGIIGYGRIGKAVRRRAVGFDMRVLVYDPPLKHEIERTAGVEHADLSRLLQESDFVTVHCSLTPETTHLLGKAEFSKMKPTAFVINTSRGPVIDEKALVDALRNGQIAGAGLDVYENEPEMAPGLKDLSNVVLLPHIASASKDTRAKMATMAATNAL
ncbi:MAG TPA: D-glycerate dehydrogenase, partial [Acidobacteriota bacterium]|nr:D-glycerate dehydrogenase [Acidobacteriota bacterium]